MGETNYLSKFGRKEHIPLLSTTRTIIFAKLHFREHFKSMGWVRI
jgi:hypothetical protein